MERSFQPTSNPPSHSNQSHQRKNHLHPDRTPKMQVSLAYLITILSLLVAVSNAEEVTGGKKTDDVESKWWAGYNTGYAMSSSYYNSYMGWPMISRGWLNSWFPSLYTGCYAYTLMGPLYNNLLFAKAADTASSTSSISRRAISLDSEQLFRRDAGDQVTCKSHKGETHTFSTSECIGAARHLSEKSLSKASVGSCTLSLVSPKDRVLAKDVSSSALEKAARSLLKACADSITNDKGHHVDAKEVDHKQVAMLLSKTE